MKQGIKDFMSTNFLSESDLTFQNNNDELQEKYAEISQFTSSLLLDFEDVDIGLIKEVQSEFEHLKDKLFENSNEILQNSADVAHKKFLMEIQTELLNSWENFGFTEGFFHRYYQIEQYLKTYQLAQIDKERIELLLKILKEQELLVIAFNVMSSKSPPVLIDMERYM